MHILQLTTGPDQITCRAAIARHYAIAEPDDRPQEAALHRTGNQVVVTRFEYFDCRLAAADNLTRRAHPKHFTAGPRQHFIRQFAQDLLKRARVDGPQRDRLQYVDHTFAESTR